MMLYAALLAVALPTPLVGYELTTPWGARPAAWAVCQPDSAPQYTWMRGDVVIQGVSNAWYWLQESDDGHELTCGAGGEMSSAVLITALTPKPATDPTPSRASHANNIFPTPAPVAAAKGDVLLNAPWGARPNAWATCEAASHIHDVLSFSWERDGTLIPGSTTSDWYFISNDDDGHQLSCAAHTRVGVFSSAPIQIGDRPPTGAPAPAPYPTPEHLIPSAEPGHPATAAPSNYPTPIPTALLTPAPENHNDDTKRNGADIKRKLDMIDFSPHLEGDVPYSILPDAVVHARVDLVAPFSDGLRTFACYNGAEAIRYAKSLGMTTAAGAWIDSRNIEAEKELACLIALAREGVIDLAVVGSEVVTWGGLDARQIVSYIDRFRAEAPGVLVTTAVKYEAIIEPSNQAIIDAVDLLYINFYPFWSGYHINDALTELQHEFAEVHAIAGGKEVRISETGWPSAGSCANGLAVPSPENQERYLREVVAWASIEAINLSWFDAFEQPWKDGSEWCNVASHWGLFDSWGVLKPGLERVLG